MFSILSCPELQFCLMLLKLCIGTLVLIVIFNDWRLRRYLEKERARQARLEALGIVEVFDDDEDEEEVGESQPQNPNLEIQ